MVGDLASEVILEYLAFAGGEQFLTCRHFIGKPVSQFLDRSLLGSERRGRDEDVPAPCS